MSLQTTQAISWPFSSLTLADDESPSEHWDIADVDWEGRDDNISDCGDWELWWEGVAVWSVGILESITDGAEDTLLRFEIRFGGKGNKGLHSIATIPSLLSEEDTEDVKEAVTWDADMTFGSRHTFAVGDATKAITSGFHSKCYVYAI